MSTPEQIQQEIEDTRRALSSNVERLSEKVTPSRIVSRRVDRVKSGVGSLREKVMGSMPDTGSVKSNASGTVSSAGDTLSSAGGAVGSAASSVSDAASNAVSTVSDAATNAPQAVRRQTQGNPLGAGLVAFGVGMVISSMLPVSEREKQLAGQAQEKVAGPLQDKAKEVAQDLKAPAQEAAQQVKETASQAASTTVDESKSAAQDVKAPLQQ